MKKRRPIQALNEKAMAIQALAEGEQASVEALQQGPPAMPVGCTTIFDTGWETNPRPTYPVGNCQSSAKDFHGCAGDCWWPAQVPDGLTNHEDFDQQCPNVARDWRILKYD
jgi:hypothetical protein